MTDDSEIDKDARRIGHKLYAIRADRKETREQLAKLIGCHPVSLFQWEAGKNLKNVIKFLRLCKKLGISPDHFSITD